ncbi:agglutinin-like [Lotus japonicus]|uniref:agglutinin-like n=1 Tax=Lotus japonicus TaxID=34305 RepID=UPI0025837767|nr:agglutinin-like [Lotus japonicus]
MTWPDTFYHLDATRTPRLSSSCLLEKSKSSGKIVNCYLNQEMEQNNSYTVGAWGGSGGKMWDDGTLTGVREIKLMYSLCIESILVVYDKQGQPFKAEKHGGVKGNYPAEIKLEYPDEFLISVSGHSTFCMGLDVCIRSLTFKSNRRTFGPYGVEVGARFTFSSYPSYEIVGFYGRSSVNLHSIGLHLSLDKTEKSIVVGPWGGAGGINWDDGAFTGVRSITLFYGSFVTAIGVVYDDHGLPFKAEQHGCGGIETAEIMLNYPVEFLINVRGHYGTVDGYGDPYIVSLTFESNHRTFGPYGLERGPAFTLPTHGRRILGFKGRGFWLLSAIGFHLSDNM